MGSVDMNKSNANNRDDGITTCDLHFLDYVAGSGCSASPPLQLFATTTTD
jgi:hypothetical protein